MGLLSELNTLPEKIPLWKKLQSVPEEMEELKLRLAKLEMATSAATGDKCPKCSKLTFALDRIEDDPTFGDLGVQRDVYICSSCGYSKYKQID